MRTAEFIVRCVIDWIYKGICLINCNLRVIVESGLCTEYVLRDLKLQFGFLSGLVLAVISVLLELRPLIFSFSFSTENTSSTVPSLFWTKLLYD